MGRGGPLNNEKNMSQIRCPNNTYQQAYPQIVKARHMKLDLNASGKDNEARMTKYNATNKNDLDMFKPRRAAVAKSFDFTVSDSSGGGMPGATSRRNMYNSSLGSGTIGGRSDISKMS